MSENTKYLHGQLHEEDFVMKLKYQGKYAEGILYSEETIDRVAYRWNVIVKNKVVVKLEEFAPCKFQVEWKSPEIETAPDKIVQEAEDIACDFFKE